MKFERQIVPTGTQAANSLANQFVRLRCRVARFLQTALERGTVLGNTLRRRTNICAGLCSFLLAILGDSCFRCHP